MKLYIETFLNFQNIDNQLENINHDLSLGKVLSTYQEGVGEIGVTIQTLLLIKMFKNWAPLNGEDFPNR